MIKFTGMSSEHIQLPAYISKLSRDHYCTYVWIVTDEINSEDRFAIAVMDYKPKRSKQTRFVFTEPVWGFIERERTEEQQNVFVRRYWYFDSISQIAKTYGFSQGKVKTMLFRMRSDLKKHLEEGGYDV